MDPCRFGGNKRGEIYHGRIKWKDLESLSEERRWELSGKTIQSWSRPSKRTVQRTQYRDQTNRPSVLPRRLFFGLWCASETLLAIAPRIYDKARMIGARSNRTLMITGYSLHVPQHRVLIGEDG